VGLTPGRSQLRCAANTVTEHLRGEPRGAFRLNAPLEVTHDRLAYPWGIKTTMPLRTALRPLYWARPECTDPRRTCST
jgi:hypothetical protein